MNIKNKLEKKIKKVVENEDRYEFPEFICRLRKACGCSRRQVNEDTNLSSSTLFMLENGTFRTFPNQQCFNKIGQYFGISPKLLKNKAEEYAMHIPHKIKKLERLRRI